MRRWLLLGWSMWLIGGMMTPVKASYPSQYDGTLYSSYGFLKVIREGQLRWVRAFVSHGIDVNRKSDQHRTPLMWAVIRHHHDIARYLIEAGARVNDRDAWGNTALHWAARYGWVAIGQLLLQFKASVNARESRFGWTPLMMASYYGQTGMVKMLLRAKADVRAVDRYGWNALALAQSEGWDSLVRLLKQEGTPEWLCAPNLSVGDFRTLCGKGR